MEYLRLIGELRPKVFLLGNAGLAFNGKDEGYRLILDQIKLINEASDPRIALVIGLSIWSSMGASVKRDSSSLAIERGLSFAFLEKLISSLLIQMNFSLA